VKILVFLLFGFGVAGVVFLLEGIGLLLRRHGVLREHSTFLDPFFLRQIFERNPQRRGFSRFFGKNPENKIHSREIMKVLLGLSGEKLEALLDLYKQQFGAGAARYARKTYRKWKSGDVRPIEQTYKRFLLHLPKVMDYDLKCEVLRHLMEEYCAKDDYKLTVYTDDWEETLEPLVRKIIDKPYRAQLPKEIEEKLEWLAEGEMQIARDILRRSQVEEGRIGVSMLGEEFANIANLLENTKGKRRVTHQLKFPYGTISLEIKSR
jgi:hypothetical protein